MNTETKFLQITTAVETQEEAERLIQLVVEKQVGASPQVQGPKKNDKPHLNLPPEDLKWRCKFKTTEKLLPKLNDEIGSFFPNGKADLTVLPIVKGSQAFFEWLEKELE